MRIILNYPGIQAVIRIPLFRQIYSTHLQPSNPKHSLPFSSTLPSDTRLNPYLKKAYHELFNSINPSDLIISVDTMFSQFRAWLKRHSKSKSPPQTKSQESSLGPNHPYPGNDDDQAPPPYQFDDIRLDRGQESAKPSSSGMRQDGDLSTIRAMVGFSPLNPLSTDVDFTYCPRCGSLFDERDSTSNNTKLRQRPVWIRSPHRPQSPLRRRPTARRLEPPRSRFYHALEAPANATGEIPFLSLD